MTAAKLLLGLGGLLQGRHVLLAGAAESSVIYRDEPDNACGIDMACSATAMVPTLRGLCVNTPTGKSCWDACNTAHGPTDYSNTSPEVKAGIALMVKQLRTGMRTGSCPGVAETPTCDPGQRCTPMGLTLGRGMCITVPNQGNQCLDMCDAAIPLTTFHDTPGKQAGTVTTVEQVRAGRDPQGRTTCPTPSVWLWLWIPIFLVCGVGFCAGAYYAFTYYRHRLKRSSPKGYNREPEQYMEDQVPFTDYNQAMPQPQEEFQQVIEEPMPVVEQPQFIAEPQTVTAPMMAAPLNTSMPAAAYTLPAAGYTTAQPVAANYTPAAYPQAGSRPAYASNYGGSMSISGNAATLPPYGAYGAYAGGISRPGGSMQVQR